MSSINGFVLAQAGDAEVLPDRDLGEILAEEVQADVGVAPDDAGMPQLDFADYAPQLVWLAITFVALYLLMSRVALPRIATVIENRRDRIANDLDTAARLREETDEVIAAYEQELAEARNKAHRIASETRQKMNVELEKEQARVETELAAKTAAAEKQVAASRDAALKEIETVAASAATDIVELLIGAKPNEKDAVAAVQAARKG